jgi:hypothetical protein
MLSGAYFFPCSIPHFFRHSKLPLTAPVPTPGISAPSCVVSRFSLPNAARFTSSGMFHRPLSAFSVPLSSLFKALKRSAGSQSIPYQRSKIKSECGTLAIVLHDVQATNRENSHAVRYNVDPHGPHTIFVDHPTGCISRNSNHSVVRALMEVWWQHAAWSKFQ